MAEVIERYTQARCAAWSRELASICRKIARKVVSGRRGTITLTAPRVVELLGVPRYHPAHEEDRVAEVGVAFGLAWTEVGGEILTIEATLMRGRGRLTVTSWGR